MPAAGEVEMIEPTGISGSGAVVRTPGVRPAADSAWTPPLTVSPVSARHGHERLARETVTLIVEPESTDVARPAGSWATIVPSG